MTTLLATLIPTAVTVLAGLIVFFRWVGKVDLNTQATKELTKAFNSFEEKITDRVADHEIRLTVLERLK